MPTSYIREQVATWEAEGPDYTVRISRSNPNKVILLYKGRYKDQLGGKHGNTCQTNGSARKNAIGEVKALIKRLYS